LFTSHRALKQAEELLKYRLKYPLLVQGERPKALLLEQFKKTDNAVLLGTSSFWEGVDVRGEALSCVIIDKLPFASPGDPVLKARLDAMTQQGKNPFFEYQVPAAVIALRQGIGRLIRDETDRGVLMVCDPRLLKRAYGQLFWTVYPPCVVVVNCLMCKLFCRVSVNFMKLLAVETATEACSAALSIDGVITERYTVAGNTHSQLILPMIDSLMKEASLLPSDLEGLAFGWWTRFVYGCADCHGSYSWYCLWFRFTDCSCFNPTSCCPRLF